MKLCLVVFFIFVSSSCYAQTWMVGASGGVNLADQHWVGMNPNSWITPGILAGAQMDYWFSKEIAGSIQILFDQKGTSAMTAADGPPGYDVTWTGNYIEVPLFIKVNTGDGSTHPYVFGGPSIGFLLSNIEGGSFYGINGTYSGNSSMNITDSTNKIDLSIVAGLGICWTLNSGTQIIADIAYAAGLQNSDNYQSDKANGIYVYSRDIRLAAGIMFPIH